MFICGSKSFGHQDKNGSHISKRSKSHKNTNKNPYADRGLDKFLALVADLDKKKQKIYDEMGSENISLIRFVYSDETDQVRPIVVRANNNKRKLLLHDLKAEKSSVEEKRDINVEPQEEELLQSFNRLRNYYFFCVMLVLVLVFLAIYGRCFAILCTSIAWYLVPRLIVQ